VIDTNRVRWRKSSFSGGTGECVELANTGLVRDSKNPAGPTLATDLPRLLQATKAGYLDR
jgi:hypothetical protein